MNKMKIIGAGVAFSLLASSLALAADNKEPASLDADTVEYDMRTGEVVATDNVLMKRGDAKVTGTKATYNIKTMAGSVIGNVIAVLGCYYGLTCPEGAEGVGRATTRTVVTSIIVIFMLNAVLTFILF